jgi:hypothetical protein
VATKLREHDENAAQVLHRTDIEGWDSRYEYDGCDFVWNERDLGPDGDIDQTQAYAYEDHGSTRNDDDGDGTVDDAIDYVDPGWSVDRPGWAVPSSRAPRRRAPRGLVPLRRADRASDASTVSVAGGRTSARSLIIRQRRPHVGHATALTPKTLHNNTLRGVQRDRRAFGAATALRERARIEGAPRDWEAANA